MAADRIVIRPREALWGDLEIPIQILSFHTQEQERVFIYRNLRKRCWSVRAKTGPRKGLVVGHVDNFTLTGVHPEISEAGRQRVLRERRKNIHAGLTGRLVSFTVDGIKWTVPGCSYNEHETPNIASSGGWLVPRHGWERIHYNPYVKGGFYPSLDSTLTVESSVICVATGSSIYAWDPIFIIDRV